MDYESMTDEALEAERNRLQGEIEARRREQQRIGLILDLRRSGLTPADLQRQRDSLEKRLQAMGG